jgi:hypothetical protein
MHFGGILVPPGYTDPLKFVCRSACRSTGAPMTICANITAGNDARISSATSWWTRLT